MAKAREEISMTQEELATTTGVTRQMISAIERDAARPSVELAKKIAAILGIDWTRFYDEENSTVQTAK